MINLFTSQASTWRGGTVKPVEPSFFWYCGGGLSSFYCCSFTLLSILYSTSFRLQNSQVIGLQARVQIANSCKVSMWDTLIIIFFVFFFSCCCSCCCLWLVWLVWLVFLHWISPRKPTQAITDENLGYRFYALWAQCDRCWLDERSVENSASKKKNKTGLHSWRFINPTISRPRKEIASRALWSKIFVGQVQGKGGGQLGNWRTEVVPCFEASTQEEAKEKRLLVETLRLTVDVDEETLETLATFFFFRLS